MSGRRKINFKFTHTDAGVHDIVYHPNGEQIITCGKDGFIRVSNTKDTDIDSPSIERSNPVNCVAVSRFGDKIVCGTEDHEVALYSFPSLDFISLLGRFTLPVHHVAFNPSGSIAAAGGDEGSIKIIVVDTAQGTNVKAHNGPVLSLAFDPKGKYLASAGADATIVIWDLSSGTNKLTTIPIAKVDPTVPYQRLRLSWDHEGRYLAVPGENDVTIIERDTWQQCAVLKGRHNSPVSLTAWSPSGRYLATCDLESKLVVWDMSTKEDLESFPHDEVITGLAWNPVGNGIVVIDVHGKQGTWDNVIPTHFPHPTSGIQAEIKKVQAVAAMLESERQEAESEAAAAAENEQAEDEDDTPMDEGASRRRLKKRIAADAEDDFMPEDVEMNEADEKKKQRKEKFEKPERKERPVAYQDHKPIQPGATPEGRKRRFLAYNMLGSIATRDEGDFSAVEIEFSDVNFHQKININDHHNFSLGALNEHGAVFACRASLETVEGEEVFVDSTINFRPFNAWSTHSEWTHQLSSMEDAICVGIAKSHVLVATSLNYLRIFTFGSAQRAVISLPGAPVCVSAEGDWAAVVYNAFPGLELLHINLVDGTTRYEGGLPLSPNSTLTWLGFAGDTVCTADSRGIVRALMYVWRQSSAPPRWVPVMDFTIDRAEGDTHWVVGINEKQVVCVECKGDIAPTVLPRPVLSVKDLKIPLINRGEIEQEEEYMRGSLFLNGKYRQAMEKGETFEALDRPTAGIEASLLRLFQAACKKDLQMRAYDYAAMLTLQKSINIAMKIAHTERRSVLKDKMGQLMDSFENRETKAELEMDKQERRDQILNATAEAVQQLEEQYNALLAAQTKLALAQSNADADASHANAARATNGHSSAAKSTSAEANNAKAKSARSLRGLASGGKRAAQDSEGEEEKEKKGEDEDEEPPAKYVSPYESEEEEEEEGEAKKEEKEEEKEEKEEEKSNTQDSEASGDKEEEEKVEKDKETEEQEEEEQPKKKTPKAKKVAAAKKPKKVAVDEDEEQKEKKTKGKKAATKKSTEEKKKAIKPAFNADGSFKNPFAIAKKHSTTPKGHKEAADEENDRKRKETSDKVTSPVAKRAKQTTL